MFPGIPADTYTVQVEMPSFKTLKHSGLFVSAGSRVAVGTLTIDVGGATETVQVKAEAPIIQAASGERSFVLEPTTYDNIPFVNGQRNYAALATFAPGMVGTSRQGSNGQNTYTMDGVLTMDTGSNGQLLQMNPESIAEVKILTSNYQAEYGRSTGVQIATVSKSGSNQFRGSVYDIYRNNQWNWENGKTWANVRNGDAAPSISKQHDRGYSIGGPIGKPGGQNKLFFFYSHEYRPRTAGGNIVQFRVPTQLERAGDFSQSRDNNGNLINALYDASTGLPKSQCVQGGATAACFQDGGVLGKIPANRLYGLGQNILNIWPIQANVTQTAGRSYNYETTTPIVDSLTSQPAFRVDYQASSKLRISGKGQFQVGNSKVVPGSIPGFNDTRNPVPYIYAWASTATYGFNNTTFFEGTYGFSQNQLGAPGVTPFYNKNNLGLGSIPTLYPDSGKFDPSYYEVSILNKYGAPFFVDGVSQLPPTMAWGANITPALPSLGYPSFLNLNRTHSVLGSLTKVAGHHTLKTGFNIEHSYKAENLNTGQAPSTQGDLNFGRDTSNPLDTGFGYANAALGIFSTYAQQNILVEGIFLHNTYEGYVQDNWKVNNRLTLDYGLRLTHLQPQYRFAAPLVELLPGRVVPGQRATALHTRMQRGADERMPGHQRPQRGESGDESDRDGSRRQQHGGDRHARAGHRGGHEWHSSGGPRHREGKHRVAETGLGAPLRGGLRPGGHAEDGTARRYRTLHRPSGPQLVRVERREHPRVVQFDCPLRDTADAEQRRLHHPGRADHGDHPVRFAALEVGTVERRRPDGASVVVFARYLPHRAAWLRHLQRTVYQREPGCGPQRARHRRRVPAAESGSDAPGELGTGRQRTPDGSSAAFPRAWSDLPEPA